MFNILFYRAGVIEELGENVSQWNIGDKVMALLPGGGYAECMIQCLYLIFIKSNTFCRLYCTIISYYENT